jgi:hypothetical protein
MAKTTVRMTVGPVQVTITTDVGWTPEMIDDSLTKVRRHVVAVSRQLGLVEDETEDAAER